MAGPAFALLHGGGQGSWVWGEVAASLEAAGARVLALDVPGCGTKRDRETIELLPDDVADELIADIRAADLGDVVLVGHSQAGTMLPLLWERAPGLFRRLVHVSCCAPGPGQSVLDLMGQGLHGQHPDEVGWPLDPTVHGKAEQRLLTLCNDMDEAQARDFLTRLDLDSWPMAVTVWPHWSYDHLRDVPSTYVRCDRDGILPPRWQERFAKRLHVDRVVGIDAGHQAMNTRPEELAKLLSEVAQ